MKMFIAQTKINAKKKKKIIENLEKAGNTFHLIIKCNTMHGY